MLTFNPSYDGGTFEESTPKLSTECLIKMMHNCVWAEKMYNELGLYDMAAKYARIWHRLFNATADRMKKKNV